MDFRAFFNLVSSYLADFMCYCLPVGTLCSKQASFCTVLSIAYPHSWLWSCTHAINHTCDFSLCILCPSALNLASWVGAGWPPYHEVFSYSRWSNSDQPCFNFLKQTLNAFLLCINCWTSCSLDGHAEVYLYPSPFLKPQSLNDGTWFSFPDIFLGCFRELVFLSHTLIYIFTLLLLCFKSHLHLAVRHMLADICNRILLKMQK